MIINIKKFNELPTPSYATEDSAGVDLYAARDTLIKPMERKAVPTGIAIELPKGYEAQIRSRSGLAIKSGIIVLNGVGTIDADYRGEIGVLLINLSEFVFRIDRGMRIAQMVFNRYANVEFNEVLTLMESERGENGFGSTGM